MGKGYSGEPQANHNRLTVAQAAASLGITEGAVRSRIKRGTLPTTKEGGTVFVLLGGGTAQANQTPHAGVPSEVTPTMVRWSGTNSGPPESPKQEPSPLPFMRLTPVVLTNISPTAGSFVSRSLTFAL